ncbi:hypothetical protein [Collinsella aerofaciens]|uniref:Uncharacterized protein n=1 Tax=Collinsella aerofaciens TaxID=74426 RepID=A0A5K1IKU5_9ACTN|nr:hypothetical protein [Collinsella aerofaciens]VWL88181.1 Uncharacterised protein [Collinsella aerofaciens]
MTPEFKPHYIAYFDVLGYKANFEGGGDVERLFDSIMDLTEQVTEARSSDALGPLGITAVSFFDNVATSCDVGASGQSESYLLGSSCEIGFLQMPRVGAGPIPWASSGQLLRPLEHRHRNAVCSWWQ